VYKLFFKDEIITDKIDKDIKEGIKAATSYIAKSLWRNKFPEWRIKEINN